MKRLLGTINKRPTLSRSPSRDEYPHDSPEGILLREVTAFCEEGQGPNHPQGEEFVHLPSIVESAESCPNAAREAAHLIRKLLSSPNTTAANIQYNAIMLTRILIDNPGHTFSRNLDAKFISTVKDLLRQGKDMGVQQFLRQTLEALEIQRSWDEDLKPLIEMWRKEKAKMDKAYGGNNDRSSTWRASAANLNSDQPFRIEPTDSLPAPDELVSRISEAKTSAKLLTQIVQSTPPTDMLSNDLIQEFSGRCRRASRAIQNYIHATNPPPDEDTLLTLIETNDELSVALSKHQRAILQARKLLGQRSPPGEQASQSPEPGGQNSAANAVRPVPPPPIPQPSQTPQSHSPPSPVSPQVVAHRSATTRTIQSDISTLDGNAASGRYEYRSEDYQVQNPFADNYSIPTATPANADNIGRANGERDRWAAPHQPAQNP
ncbi:VHS and GAT domain-containing protein [Aspergillus lucknowensis]|uniref:GAT domain-containing protein n=1 Tax=Aspergillus lucknowensis TaxID=176173 RepID=A0ABR4LH21_9EURO